MALKVNHKKQPLFKDVQLKRPHKSLLQFLHWKGFTDDDDELLVLTDETGQTTGYLDMLTVLGKDLDFVYGQGTEGASAIINGYNRLLRTFLTDFDILITQMPADSHVQHSNWSLELQRVNRAIGSAKNDPKQYQQLINRHDFIRKQISLTTYVSSHINHEAYTAFIYGDNVAETIRLRNAFQSVGGTALTTQAMNLDQKKFILSILSDPTRQLIKG